MGTSSVAEEESTTEMATEHGELNGSPNGNVPFEDGEAEITIAQRFSHQIDALISKADELEQRVNEVSKFYANKRQSNTSRGTIRGRKEEVCTNRMQKVMQEFGKIFEQLSRHEWAWPFMQPVDVVGLGLDDYYEIIKKPMDFSTIKKKMEANGYKNAREIYADVRLVFSNAMTYNEDTKNDVHVMAKKMLEKFEEKWLQLLPKVIEVETRQKEDEAQAMANMQIAQETTIAKLARDTNNELNKLNLHVAELRELVIQRSSNISNGERMHNLRETLTQQQHTARITFLRKITTEEKRKISAGISALSHDHLVKVMDIVAQGNPDFQVTEEVELDMDAQSDITQWRLKFFVMGALEIQAKNAEESKVDGMKKIPDSNADDISKRKRVIYDALTNTARKRNSKLSS